MKQIIFFLLLLPVLAFSQTGGNFLLPDSSEIWRGESGGEIHLDGDWPEIWRQAGFEFETLDKPGVGAGLYIVGDPFFKGGHDYIAWPDSIPRKGETQIEPARKFYEQYPGPHNKFFGYQEGLTNTTASQKEPFKLDLSPFKRTGVTLFLSGAFDGLNQTLNFHYPKFKRAFPEANDQFWNPAVSWENKYAKDGQGATLTDYEAFPFSTSILVWTTDGHHLSRAGDHVSMYTTVGLYFSDLGKKNWKQITFDILTSAFIRSVGFVTVYQIGF